MPDGAKAISHGSLTLAAGSWSWPTPVADITLSDGHGPGELTPSRLICAVGLDSARWVKRRRKAQSVRSVCPYDRIPGNERAP
jgi:hypothetical protein